MIKKAQVMELVDMQDKNVFCTIFKNKNGMRIWL